jgi:hypothetical protein
VVTVASSVDWQFEGVQPYALYIILEFLAEIVERNREHGLPYEIVNVHNPPGYGSLRWHHVPKGDDPSP